jgi:hypothetical protein
VVGDDPMGCRDRQPSRFTISRLLEIGATAATTAQHGLDAGLPFTPRLPLVALMIAAGFLGTLDQAIPTIVALDLVLRSA